MSRTVYLGQDCYYVGASDMRLSRFENMIPLLHGVSYNSFLILDEKTCVLDTVDRAVVQDFIANVQQVLNGRKLDYLVIQHMEPDHCAGIVELLRLYPEIKLIGNMKTFMLLKQFRGVEVPDQQIIVKEGDVLDLGKHKLQTIMAPMVHWPEVLFHYDQYTQTIYTADAFGCFNYLTGSVWSDQVNYDEYWLPEARRYYLNIVGKQGANVEKVLKKAEALEIKQIMPLHGVFHRDPEIIAKLMKLYKTWGSFEPEEKGMVFVYSSMYGNMEELCLKLSDLLAERGIGPIGMYDVSHTDESYILTECFRYSHAVFGVVNHNTQLYHKMDAFLHLLAATNYSKRKVSILASKSWGGQAAKQAREQLEAMKGIEIIGDTFEILSTYNEETQAEALAQLADQICESFNA